jgi:hypothetical protein
MRKFERGYLNDAGVFGGIVIALVLVGFFVGGFVFVILPEIWDFLKPLIHRATK